MVEIPFNVSARTAHLIGQQNFANAEGAVIELIKNSYDADASICVVIIDSLGDQIFIIDNGEGMTIDIIRNHWMTIGTDNKQSDYQTRNNRIKTGAKGIGRFALDRLGNNCQMKTVTKESKDAIEWNVDWTQFQQQGKVLSQITATLEELPNFDIQEEISEILDFYPSLDLLSRWDQKGGTLIRIKNLKDDWDERAVQDLYSNLEMLVPPLEEETFMIWYLSTEQHDKYGLIESARCDDYDYKIEAQLDSNREVKIKLFRNELDLKGLKNLNFFKETKLKSDLYLQQAFEQGVIEFDPIHVGKLIPGFKDVDSRNTLDKIGPFSFTFYFMKRGGGQEKKDEGSSKYPYKYINYRDRADWLKKFAGIKIYRDKFRVRPYGESSSSSFDWLGLGQRALKNPTVTRPGYGVRPQQIYGIVNISRIDNINFEDKSSREGLQENDAFQVFKQLLLSIIGTFENDRNQIMMSLYEINKEKNKRERAKSDADKKLEEEESNTNNEDNKSSSGANTYEDTFKEAYKAVKEELDELKDEQKLLKVLASAGLIVTSFAHELKNLSDRIVPRTDDLRVIFSSLVDDSLIKELEDFNNPFIMLDDMRSQDERLKHWLDFALAAVRKNKRNRRKIDMVGYIEGLQRMWASLLKRREIDLVIDKKNFVEVYFTGYEIDLDGIFNNLIANSIDAFRREDASDNRTIKLGFEFNFKTGINVVYEDSGPGLSEDIIDPNKIFEPFFTTKRDKKTGEMIGTGLGLWIVKSTIDEYEGDLELVTNSKGFKLKLVLPYGE